MEARRALTLARAKHVQNNKDTITTIEQTETHKKTKEASTNDVDADDDNNNNKNNSMTKHPVVVATLLVLWIVPVDVPDSSRSHHALLCSLNCHRGCSRRRSVASCAVALRVQHSFKGRSGNE